MSLAKPIPLIVLFLLIAIVHIVGLHYLWYHKLWWIDIVMHTAGGLWVGMLAVYVKRRFVPGLDLPWWVDIIYILGAVMIIGVAWEWGEYLLDALFFPRRFAFRLQLGLGDTMGDLLSDFCGGFLFSLWAVYKESHKHV